MTRLRPVAEESGARTPGGARLRPGLAAAPARLFCLLAVLLLASPAAAQDFAGAQSAYRNRDYVTALARLRPLAEAGQPAAQSLLGQMYAAGLGVARDDALAAEWLRKAAGQGEAAAQFHLGELYARGAGVDRDVGQALDWFRRAAAQGNVEAEALLAEIYRDGWGMPVDRVEAYRWASRAAGQGSRRAARTRDALARLMTPAERARAAAGSAAAPPPVPRPPPRKGRSATPAKPAAGARQSAAGPVAAGTFQVQLGYYRDAAQAQRALALLKAARGDLLAAVDLEILVNSTAGGERFYRLLTTPPSSRSAAAALCRALKRRGVDCFTRRRD